MSKFRKADIYIKDVFAGILSETDYGYSFKYDNDYLKNPFSTSLSLTMPKTDKEYKSNILFPFLMDLFLKVIY